MIDWAEVATAVLTVIGTLLPIVWKQYRSAIAKAMRIGATVLSIGETLKEMEKIQTHLLNDMKELLDKVRRGEMPTADEITHLAEHVKEKLTHAERLENAILTLRKELTGGL